MSKDEFFGSDSAEVGSSFGISCNGIARELWREGTGVLGREKSADIHENMSRTNITLGNCPLLFFVVFSQDMRTMIHAMMTPL